MSKLFSCMQSWMSVKAMWYTWHNYSMYKCHDHEEQPKRRQDVLKQFTQWQKKCIHEKTNDSLKKETRWVFWRSTGIYTCSNHECKGTLFALVCADTSIHSITNSIHCLKSTKLIQHHTTPFLFLFSSLFWHPLSTAEPTFLRGGGNIC